MGAGFRARRGKGKTKLKKRAWRQIGYLVKRRGGWSSLIDPPLCAEMSGGGSRIGGSIE